MELLKAPPPDTQIYVTRIAAINRLLCPFGTLLRPRITRYLTQRGSPSLFMLCTTSLSLYLMIICSCRAFLRVPSSPGASSLLWTLLWLMFDTSH